MLREAFFLALKTLKHRGIRSLLTMLGIFIGIAAVISLISLGQGLQEAIIGQFSTLSADRLLIQNAGSGFGPPGSTAIKKLTEHDLDLVERIPGVSQTITRIIRIAKVEYNGIVIFNFIGSLPEEKDKIDFVYQTFSLKPSQGDLLGKDDRDKVLLGSDFSKENRFGKSIRAGSILEIQGRSFEVAGILKEAGSFQFNSAIFMSEKDLKEIMQIQDEIDAIVVQVADQDRTEEVAESIQRKLRKDRGLKEGEEDFSVQTPLQFLGTIKTILNIVNLVVAGIAAISLLVGGLGITNTMYTSVLERTKEIGTMKAVGAQNKDILLIFLIESGLLGLVGGVIGTFLGLGMAFSTAEIANSYFGETILKVKFSYYLILGALGFSCTVGIASGILPAFRASRLTPVEALRS